MRKKSVEKEAVSYVSDKLQERFKMDNVKEADGGLLVQDVAKSLEFENDIIVTLRLKKNAREVESAARKIQVPWTKDVPVALALKSIDRGR